MTIWVDDKPVQCVCGSTLLNALLNAGVVVQTACGGQGTCHLCRVTIASGEVPAASPAERRALGNVLLAQGMRLSCQVRVEGPLHVHVPDPDGARRALLREARRALLRLKTRPKKG